VTRIPRALVDAHNPQSIVDAVRQLQDIADGRLAFGSPQDPTDPQSATRANGVAHNGSLENIQGSWVEAVVTGSGQSRIVTFTHNLDLPVITDQPNVRWLHFGSYHDGTGAVATTRVWVFLSYIGGDTVTNNAIDLRLATLWGATPTVDASHPLVVSVFFTPAIRGA
jgi:hypothetical protein